MPLQEDYDAWKDESREDRRFLTRMGVKVLLGFLVLAALLTLVSFACGWLNTGKEIVSPANVKKQYATAYTDYNGLEALARQSCRLEAEAEAATDPAVETQRRTQVLAIGNQYDSVSARYEAKMQNLFEAKIVRPRDLPPDAPTLTEMQATVC